MDKFKVELMSKCWEGWYETRRFETYAEAQAYVREIFSLNKDITHSSITSLTEGDRK